jgi:hypothetical protein
MAPAEFLKAIARRFLRLNDPLWPVSTWVVARKQGG